jgi:hypothetical protein
MKTNKHLLLDESNNGKYIIVKIPRNTLHGKATDPSTLFSDQREYRRAFLAIGFVIAFFLGIIVGSVYHDHILTINSNHATWKMFTTAAKGH